MKHADDINSATFSPDCTRVVTASEDKTARIWVTPPVASNIIATACKMLRDYDATDLSIHYGIEVKDPICTGDEPAPTPSSIIDR